MNLISYARNKHTEFFEIEMNPLWKIHVKRRDNGDTYMFSELHNYTFRKDRFKKVDRFYTRMIKNELEKNGEIRLKAMFMPYNTRLLVDFNDRYDQTLDQEEPYANLKTKHLFFDR